MQIEKYWYEVSPFVYTTLGGYLLGRADSALMVVSAIVLLIAAGTITLLRRKHALDALRKHRKS